VLLQTDQAVLQELAGDVAARVGIAQLPVHRRAVRVEALDLFQVAVLGVSISRY
jgi:hypothetical protein